MLRPELQAKVSALIEKVGAGGQLSLLDFAAALGTLPVDAAEIDEMFRGLEAHQIAIADAKVGSLLPLLGAVLNAARELRAAGAPSNPRAIALKLCASESQVRAALLLSRTLG